MAYVSSRGIVIEPETPVLHDLDSAVRWVTSQGSGEIDANQLLVAWNLFSDVAASVGKQLDDDTPILRDVYSGLVQRNNLPALSVPGADPPEPFSAPEREVLCDVLCRGLELFTASLPDL